MCEIPGPISYRWPTVFRYHLEDYEHDMYFPAETVSDMINVFTARDFFATTEDTTVLEKTKCYSLPFGALGFISHLLTYYTIVCLGHGRSPLAPCYSIKRPAIGLFVAILGLATGIPLATITIIKCRNHWELAVLGVWELSTTILNGIVAIHVNLVVKDPTADTRAAFRWVVPYAVGAIPGYVGMLFLIREYVESPSSSNLLPIAIAVPTCIAIIPLWTTLIFFNCGGIFPWLKFLYSLISGFVLTAALISDWTLGVMAHDLAGMSNGDNIAVSSLYWVAMRLAMISIWK